MLGSNNTYFKQSTEILLKKRVQVQTYLEIKDYSKSEIEIYLKAYDYFSKEINEYDGATIVKDLVDLPHLDLDAMLHDYHYIVYRSATNFSTKWKADWIYAKGQERKGKGQYSAFSRFIGLTIIGIVFVPYAYLKRGKLNWFDELRINEDYRILIKKTW